MLRYTTISCHLTQTFRAVSSRFPRARFVLELIVIALIRVFSDRLNVRDLRTLSTQADGITYLSSRHALASRVMSPFDQSELDHRYELKDRLCRRQFEGFHS